MNHAVSRTTRVRLLRMVGLLAAILCAALLLAEAGARVLVCHFAPDEAFCGCCSLRQYKKHGAGKSRLIPHPYLGFNLQPNLRRSSSTNSLGYRGKEVEVPKPPGQFRVVCLGGSTTYDDCIEDDTLTYPARLEYHLRERGYNVRVVNAGVPGWTSYESLINYAFRVSYLEPDMVILFDAWNDLSAHVVYPPSAYVSDNTGMKGAGPCVFLFYEQSMLVRIFLVGSGRVLPQLMRALNQTAPHVCGGVSTRSFLQEDLVAQRPRNEPADIFHEQPQEHNRNGRAARRPNALVDVSLQQDSRDVRPLLRAPALRYGAIRRAGLGS